MNTKSLYINVNNREVQCFWFTKTVPDNAHYSVAVDIEEVKEVLRCAIGSEVEICLVRRASGISCYVNDYRVSSRDAKWGVGIDIFNAKVKCNRLLQMIDKAIAQQQ